MSTSPWLPARLDQATFPDETSLEAAAWAIFQHDFANFPQFRGQKVVVSSHPHPANPARSFTYWHCVTEGTPERTRTGIIPERMACIPWTRPVIENEACKVSAIKVWSNQRDGNTHVCIWFDRVNYMVVLAITPSGFLLKTTYSPESRRKQQLHKEYARWKKSGARL